MFSNLVATLRADLDAIRDDFGGFVETVKEDASEFVETVRTDATQVMGMVQNSAPGGLFSLPRSGGDVLSWEEELWDDPELLCEDPEEEGWLGTFALLKPEEVDMFLSAPEDGIIPELYRELVPAKASHDEFFQRLAFHRNRLTLRARQLQQQQNEQSAAGGEEDEEAGGWDDDEVVSPAKKPAAAVVGENEGVIVKLQQRILELEAELKASEEKRRELELVVAESRTKKRAAPEATKPAAVVEPEEQVEEEVAVEHQEVAVERQEVAVEHQEVAVVEVEDDDEEEEEEQEKLKTPSSSWEALSESVDSPEPVVKPDPVPVPKKVALDDNEEDDWE
ncbi:hypothetical protein BASA81_002675 [Batrachochytrium salamandrivorans]|nr:hypothetical protein BASA81_002675 [Batrachochytrium salamandrivorans]